MAINWITICKQYKGKWVALKRDEKTVIASGTNASVAYKKALQKGLKNPILSFVPINLAPMVGAHEI